MRKLAAGGVVNRRNGELIRKGARGLAIALALLAFFALVVLVLPNP